MAEENINNSRRDFLKQLGLFGATVLNPLPTNFFDAYPSKGQAKEFAGELYEFYRKIATNQDTNRQTTSMLWSNFESHVFPLPEIGPLGESFIQDAMRGCAQSASTLQSGLIESAKYFSKFSKDQLLALLDAPEVAAVISETPLGILHGASYYLPDCGVCIHNRTEQMLKDMKDLVQREEGILKGSIEDMVKESLTEYQADIAEGIRATWREHKLESVHQAMNEETKKAMHDDMNYRCVEGIKPREAGDGYIVYCKPVPLQNPASFRERHGNKNTEDYKQFLIENFGKEVEVVSGQKDWFVVKCSEKSQAGLCLESLSLTLPHQGHTKTRAI